MREAPRVLLLSASCFEILIETPTKSSPKESRGLMLALSCIAFGMVARPLFETFMD